MEVQSRSNSKKIGELVCDGAMKFVDNFAVEINGERVAEYKSLDAVAKDWEDYKPAEPYIKDKKVRKAVRAWAEANRYDKLWVYHDRTVISFYNKDDGDNDIIFNTVEKFGLENLKCYTITELCGEEG